MKKCFLFVLATISLIFVICAISVYAHKRDSRDFFYQNVEALADDEGNQNYSDCYNSFELSETNYVLICGACQFIKGKGNNIGGRCYF